MPRQAKKAEAGLPARTLVLDNGAYTMKAGFASADAYVSTDCYIIPNCIARGSDGGRGHRIYIADQLDQCKDFAEMTFKRPVERGCLVNWDAELDIWKQSFFNPGAKLQCDPHETNLILTGSPNCPQALETNCDQMIFEEFEFASYYRCLAGSLNAYNDIPALTGDPSREDIPAECILLIDSGYSHTTVTPVISGRPVKSAIRRLDIGGRFLTNRLKELVSLRHYGLMDDPHLVSQIKEDVCFVSQNFERDLDRAWKGSKKDYSTLDNIVVDYVLPDYKATTRGHTREHDPSPAAAAARLGVAQQQTGQKEDFFPLGNERFVVPELIFNPRDISMPQAGLAETVIQSLSVLPAGIWPAMLANVIVVGGNAKISGFVDRLETELRSLVPSECVLRVKSPEDPVTYTWLGGTRLASKSDLLKHAVVTRQEYQEYGSAWVARKFSVG